MTLTRVSNIALMVTALMIVSQPCFGKLRPTDYTITKRVERALKSDLRLRDLEIKVKTTAGNVLLSGIVPGYVEKDRARRVCERVDGVETVKCELQVKLIGHSDDEIAREIQQRFQYDVLLRSQDLRVEVERRIVTIEGEVENHWHRQRAEEVARAVPDVMLVRNSIQLTGSSRSDDAVRTDIIERLDQDGALLGFPISIRVDRGVVTLDGIVRHHWQRELAGSLSQSVIGVREVENLLETMK